MAKGVALVPLRALHTCLCSPAASPSPPTDGKIVAGGQTGPEERYVPSVTAMSLMLRCLSTQLHRKWNLARKA